MVARPTTADEVRAALVESGGNIRDAAGELGLATATLWKRVKRFGLLPLARELRVGEAAEYSGHWWELDESDRCIVGFFTARPCPRRRVRGLYCAECSQCRR